MNSGLKNGNTKIILDKKNFQRNFFNIKSLNLRKKNKKWVLLFRVF